MENLIKQRDNFADEYDNFYFKTHKHFSDELNSILRALNLNYNDILLDAGCGTGNFTRYFKCKKIIGIDYSPKSIEIFKTKNIKNTEVLVGDLTEFNKYFENKFDKIISIQVIQHIPTRELKLKALKNIKRYLKEDGIFVCELQDHNSFYRILRRIYARLKGSKIPKEEITEDFYIYRFNQIEFRKLLEEAGFKENLIIKGISGGYFITISKKLCFCNPLKKGIKV